MDCPVSIVDFDQSDILGDECLAEEDVFAPEYDASVRADSSDFVVRWVFQIGQSFREWSW